MEAGGGQVFTALADGLFDAGLGGEVQEALVVLGELETVRASRAARAGSLPAARSWAARASGISTVTCMGVGYTCSVMRSVDAEVADDFGVGEDFWGFEALGAVVVVRGEGGRLLPPPGGVGEHLRVPLFRTLVRRSARWG